MHGGWEKQTLVGCKQINWADAKPNARIAMATKKAQNMQ
jgi:hypothetical protein